MRPNDSIADMLTRVRNAQKAGQEVVSIPASKIKIALAHILKNEGFIRDYKCIRDTRQGVLKVALAYDDNGDGVIGGLHRVSTPSRRSYVAKDKIPFIRSGLGVAILSTSKGVMSDRDARKQNLGGELLCSVY